MSESGIFKAAVKLPPDRRAAYLDQACCSDAELRAEIESLLHAHDATGGFLEHVQAAPGRTEDYQTIAERPGTVIGPYKLMEQIGEGGFGLVFVAEQQHPIRRKLVLKIIKPGMDTREIIARFEAERQALALMDHANIARVFDAGTTKSGRPYFVMELVKGFPIGDYCDSAKVGCTWRWWRISIRGRLSAGRWARGSTAGWSSMRWRWPWPVAGPARAWWLIPIGGASTPASTLRGFWLAKGIACSMSRRANCWDNAPMESFFASPKKELTHGETIEAREQARAILFEYIEVFFNRVRRHSSPGYKSPAEYELVA
jgi:Integrase core domain/Protein tyrosine and serine/threonine kinase